MSNLQEVVETWEEVEQFSDHEDDQPICTQKLQQQEVQQHDLESGKSNEESSGMKMKLAHIIENLILLGMCSICMWDKVLKQMKCQKEICLNAECVSLYWNLNHLFMAFCSKLNNSVENRSENVEMSYEEMMKIFTPILKRKPYKDETFTVCCVNTLTSVARSIIQKIALKESESTKPVTKSKRKLEKSDSNEKCKKAKKQKEDSSESEQSDDNETDDEDDNDEFEKLFQTKGNSGKSIKIKQLLQYRKDKKVKKIFTPGEEGSYMIKIELTDVKDLKDCDDQSTYWTKVSKKAIFLLEKSDEKIKTINELFKSVGKNLKLVEGVRLESKKIGREKRFY